MYGYISKLTISGRSAIIKMSPCVFGCNTSLIGLCMDGCKGNYGQKITMEYLEMRGVDRVHILNTKGLYQQKQFVNLLREKLSTSIINEGSK